jgi:hypothetical protein
MSEDPKEPAEKVRRIDPALLGWMRFFFYAAHFVIPLAALALIVVYVVGNLGCHRFQLSWELLVVVAVALLPFLLPLAAAYIGKIGPVELKDGLPQEGMIPRTAPAAAPPQLAAAPAEIDPGPNFDALTEDEKSVLKTLWVHQPSHTASGGAGWWCFNVPANSPTYKNFLRGAGTLAERKLVSIDKGMVHLNDKGLAYCDLNKDHLAKVVSYWSVFRPASR